MNNNKYRRLISFLVLLAIIVLIGALFYQVMASFVLPLFLAAVLVVVFAPIHNFICHKYKAKPRLAALTTTGIIGLAVLLPMVITITFAIIETSNLIGTITPAFIADSLADVRHQFHLDIPQKQHLTKIESQLKVLSDGSTDIQTDASSNRASLQQLQVLVSQISPLETGNTKANERLSELKSNIQQIMADANKQPPATQRGQYLTQLVDINDQYNRFKTALLGGTINAAVIEAVNPTPEQIRQYSNNFFDSNVRKQILSVGANTLGFSFRLLAGIVIMLVATYFFLVDGNRMVQSITKLSPLKEDYEQTLIDEFVSISRAVVIATLLSALVQGVLAGFGFWVAGLESVMMLTVAATLLSLVPFIGAAAVWFPCALYLIVFADSPEWGIFLLVWGIGPVSMADNIVKPFILQNKSKLHPMLALLSVVGGVQALGPIGILTGPMVVVFLQTLLNMLHRELSSVDEDDGISAANEKPEPTPNGSESASVATSSEDTVAPKPSD